MFGLLPAVALALLAVDAQAMKLDFLRFPRRALDSTEEHALSKRAPTYITNFTLPDTNYTYVDSFIYNGYLSSILHPAFPFRTLPTSSTSPYLSSSSILRTSQGCSRFQLADDQIYWLLYRYYSQASLRP